MRKHLKCQVGVEWLNIFCCSIKAAAEQKARSTYEYILSLTDDPDVMTPIKFLREREVVHFQRFGEGNREDGNRRAKYNPVKIVTKVMETMFTIYQ